MRLLVVCHGNINRSAFVPAIIRAARPGWEVRSAGMKTRDGRPASPKARRAAAEHGLDLSEHRSSVCTLALLRWAHLTLYMDNGNWVRLLALTEQASTDIERQVLRHRCQPLATYGCLRRVPDPNYTSDPVKLAEMFAAAELCTLKFLEAHP